ncbi:MAG TPA: hypothetical protein VIB02_11840 [Candidatus Limnocylindrales bacterium]
MNDWVCGNCKSINRPSANSCYSCGGAREIVAAPDPRVAQPAPTGTDAPTAALATAAVAAPLPPPSGSLLPTLAVAPPASSSDLVGGLVAGLVAAVLATAIWYAVVVVTHFQVGIVAIAVGFLVGQGVVLGARGRSSIALVVASVVLTLAALVASEYLIVAHFVGQDLDVQLDMAQPPDVILGVVYESVVADPLTLAFWAIALFQAVAIPWRAMSAPAARPVPATPDAA